MSLKMAKASTEEWERVMRFVNELEHELKYCEMTDEQLGKWVRDKAPPMTRTVFGYSVLVDNCCDPNESTLQWKPEWLEAMRDKDRLDWLLKPAGDQSLGVAEINSVQGRATWHFTRDAIDAAMPSEKTEST